VAHSKTTDFTRTLFVLTSNVGEKAIASEKRRGIGFTHSAQDISGDAAVFERELKGYFAPEFLGRLEVVRCHSLRPDHLREAVRRYVGRLNHAIKTQKYQPEVEVFLTDPYIDYVLQHGKGAEYGARAISGCIRRVATEVGMVLHSGRLTSEGKEGILAFDIVDDRPNIRYIEQGSNSFERDHRDQELRISQLVETKIQKHADSVRHTVRAFCDLILRYDDQFSQYYLLYRQRLQGYGFSAREVDELENQLYRDAYSEIEPPKRYENILHARAMFSPLRTHTIDRFLAICVQKDFSLSEIYFHIRILLNRPITQEEQIVIAQHLHRYIQKKHQRQLH